MTDMRMNKNIKEMEDMLWKLFRMGEQHHHLTNQNAHSEARECNEHAKKMIHHIIWNTKVILE